MENNTGKVFVYGTLKEGGHFAASFNDNRIGNKKATLKGTMFAVHFYPCIILEGNNTIIGEVHEYDNFDVVIGKLDNIEGCSGKVGVDGDLYHRKMVTVNTEDGNEQAWVYVFNKNTENLEVVKSGKWLI